MLTKRMRTGWLRISGASLVLAIGGCDFTVTNPGPVQDEFLDDPAAHQALINGMGRALGDALNYVGYTGAAVAREIHPGGSSGNFGISVRQQMGILADDDTDEHWSRVQQARWIGDHAVERMREALDESAFQSSPLVAQAFLWRGFAYRTLGENMCEITIDEGPIQPRSVAFERAEESFAEAIQVAGAAGLPDLVSAAYAGRAAARMYLEDWSGAVADAQQVADDFAYEIPFYDVGDDQQYNRIYFSVAARPFKAHTVWNTAVADYFDASGDPRTPYRKTEDVGDAAIECCGQVPWWPQEKYAETTAPLRLAGGREMRLIEAEARLRDGDWQGAMQIVNAQRARLGVSPWPASSLEEAWTRLKRERGIELWLEARRLGDLWRWQSAGTPGALHALEEGEAAHLSPDRDLCFPISRSERDTNPNLQ